MAVDEIRKTGDTDGADPGIGPAHEGTGLTRSQFRQAVLARDGGLCVICRAPAVDAHHILERRLFPDGGYDLDNGASLCVGHHVAAEQTSLSCEEIRRAAGIQRVVLPPQFLADEQYDKWGNPILPNGTRMRGELFDDPSVQKVLAPVLSVFTKYVKHPRIFHLPWSPGRGDDDRAIESTAQFEGYEICVTEKYDGENTSLYSDYIHARSLEYNRRVDRTWMKRLHASICADIPEGWRICGENLWGRHSIAYENLSSFFLVHSVWDDRNICLSWTDTVFWAEMLGLVTVPVLFRGRFSERELRARIVPGGSEGYVVRLAQAFHYRQFGRSVAKYVRAGHVQTQAHWTRQIMPNRLREEGGRQP